MTLAKYLRDRHKALTENLALATRYVDKVAFRMCLDEIEAIQQMHAERSDKSRRQTKEGAGATDAQ